VAGWPLQISNFSRELQSKLLHRTAYNKTHHAVNE